MRRGPGQRFIQPTAVEHAPEANAARSTQASALEAARAFPVEQVVVAALDGDYARLEKMSPLGPDVAAILVEKKRNALARELTGVDWGSDDYERRLRDGQGTNPVLEAALYRLVHRSESFVALLDRDSGRVELREGPAHKLEELEACYDKAKSVPLARALLGGPEAATDERRQQIAQAAASWVPTDAWRVLTEARVNIDVVATPADVATASGRVEEMFGKAAAALKRLSRRRHLGVFTHETNACTVALGIGFMQFKTAFTHEVMHALDQALTKDGVPFSESPEWRDLWDKTLAYSSGGRRGALEFPTAYSRTSRAEFFAECATMFLIEHVVGAEPFLLSNRDHLLRVNPEAYRIMRQLFTRTLPARPRMPPEAYKAERISYLLNLINGKFSDGWGSITIYPGWLEDKAKGVLDRAADWRIVAGLAGSRSYVDEARKALAELDASAGEGNKPLSSFLSPELQAIAAQLRSELDTLLPA